MIDEIAFQLKLAGFVKNLPDGTVSIVCEGNKSDIEKFLKRIRVQEFPIWVEDIKTVYSKPTGEFKDFQIIREENLTKATYERLDMAARYMRNMNTNIGNKMDNLGGKMDNLGGKMDNVGNKVDTLGGDIQSMNTNLGSKIDSMHSDINKNFSSIDQRYGDISKNLIGAVQGIEGMLEKGERDRQDFRDAVKELAEAIRDRR